MAILFNGDLVVDETFGLQKDDITATLPGAFLTVLSASTSRTPLELARSVDDFIKVSDGNVSNLQLLLTSNGAPTGRYTLEGKQIFLYTTSNPNVVIGREGTDGTTANATGDVVLALYLETTLSSTTTIEARMWSVLYEPLQHGSNTGLPDETFYLLNENLKVSATSSETFDFSGIPPGNNLFLAFGDTDSAIVVTAKNPANQSTGVNVSSGDTVNTSGASDTTIGVSDQMIKAGRGAYFTFVTGMDANYTVPNMTHDEATSEANILFTGLIPNVTSAKVFISQTQGNAKAGTVQLTALTTALETGVNYIDGLGTSSMAGGAANDTKVNILSVKVWNGAVEVTNQTTISITAGVARVEGVKTGWSVEYFTAAAHNRVLVDNPTNSTQDPFDIGGFALGSTTPITAVVGDKIGVADDGPAAVLALGNESAVADESTGADAGDTGLAAPNDEAGRSVTLVNPAGLALIGYDQAQVISITNQGYGTDGAGTRVLTLELGSGAGTNSNLTTTAGDSILLYSESGVIVGRTGGPSGTAVFAVAIDATGKVTVEQYGSIDHLPNTGADQVAYLGAGSIKANLVVTDADTDAATSSLMDISGSVGFEDDAPKVTLTLAGSASLTVDESVGADAGDPNAFDEDGNVAGDIGYASISGASLFSAATVDIGEDGEGSSSSFSLRVGNGSSDTLATTLKTSNGDQLITLAKINATTVEGRYGSDGGDLDSFPDNLAFRITIDASTGAMVLSQFVALEHPTTGSSHDEALALGANRVFAVLSATDGDGDGASGVADVGALMSFQDDGPKLADGPDLLVANTLNATDTDQFAVRDVGSDTPGGYRILDPAGSFTRVSDAEIVGKQGTTDFYRLTVDGSGNYTFTLLDTLVGTEISLNTNAIKAGGPDTNFIDVGAKDIDGVPVAGQVVRISGFVDANGDGNSDAGEEAAINESNLNVGVNTGNLDAGEILAFELVNDTTPGTIEAGYTGIPISKITVSTKTAQKPVYEFNLYLDDQLVGDGTITTTVKNATLTLEDNGVLFDRAELKSIDGNAVKIGLSGIKIFTQPDDVVLDFSIRLTDADADTATASFQVGIDGDGGGVDFAAFAVASNSLYLDEFALPLV